MNSEKDREASISARDRRRSPRRPLVNLVWYKIMGEESDEMEPLSEGAHMSCDISETGLGLQCTAPMPVGKKVFIEIATEDLDFSAIGKIVYSKATSGGYYRVGIDFIVVPPNDRLLPVIAKKKREEKKEEKKEKKEEKKEILGTRDRREATRHILVNLMWYKILDDESGETGPSGEGISKSRDISETGVGIYVTRPMPVGKNIFIELAVKDFSLSALGKIVYSTPTSDGYHRVGIKFVVVPPKEHLLLIKRFGKVGRGLWE